MNSISVLNKMSHNSKSGSKMSLKKCFVPVPPFSTELKQSHKTQICLGAKCEPFVLNLEYIPKAMVLDLVAFSNIEFTQILNPYKFIKLISEQLLSGLSPSYLLVQATLLSEDAPNQTLTIKRVYKEPKSRKKKQIVPDKDEDEEEEEEEEDESVHDEPVHDGENEQSTHKKQKPNENEPEAVEDG
jgi:hypothetical protein